MIHIATKSSFGLFVTAAVLTTMFNGCDGCSCQKKEALKVTQEIPTKPKETGLMKGDRDTPRNPGISSPMRELAEHFQIDLQELIRIKVSHHKLPGIKRPAKFEKTASTEVASGDTTKLRKEYKIEMSADNLTDMPDIKLILATPFNNPAEVLPKELRESVETLRQMLWEQKVPVFSEPVLLMHSPLESAESPMTLIVGLPVPVDFEVPDTFKTLRLGPQKILFGDRLTVPGLGAVGKETYQVLTSDSLTGLIRTGCLMGILLVTDNWSKIDADTYPSGDTYLYCR